MKRRVAWLGDAEHADTYSARECRILLPALARDRGLVVMWFALGSTEAPHLREGVRVFPIPGECLATAEFLGTLISQQRPDLLVSNLPFASFPAGFHYLGQSGLPWLRRVSPEEDKQSTTAGSSRGLPRPRGSSDRGAAGDAELRNRRLTLLGHERGTSEVANARCVPYVKGLGAEAGGGADATAVLGELRRAILDLSLPGGTDGPSVPTHLVMRQQLFCNTSWAQVMFELTNALIELGVPTVPQDDHLFLAKGYIHREEELLRTGSPAKYERIRRCLGTRFDPEGAITIHFSLFRSGVPYTRHSLFPSLAGREVLYSTGNHTVEPTQVRRLMQAFHSILAPSRHVLRPYLEAGLSPRHGAVVPHGIDPAVYSPQAAPLPCPSKRGFRFLQSSFPWISEKGWDLTLKAFGKAFSSKDDVALILRTPHIRNEQERAATFGRLEQLVAEARAKPAAPEIELVELDVEPNRRGGLYTSVDCYVHPLRAEGFGITILEAMACGLPVIATPWSGPADFLSPRYAYTLGHGAPVPEKSRSGAITRYHVEPDLDHLVHLMRHVYEHRDEAKAVGLRAARVAHAGWTWQDAAKKLASVFAMPCPGESATEP